MLRREVGVQKPLLTRDILFVFEDNIWLYRYIQEEQKLYLSDASFEEFRCGPSVTFDAFGDPAPGISRDVGESSLTFFVLGRDVDTATWCGSDGPRFIAPEMLHWPAFGASCDLRSSITASPILNRRHQSGTNASGFASTIKPDVKYVLVAKGVARR
jgi:hypothetical protein